MKLRASLGSVLWTAGLVLAVVAGWLAFELSPTRRLESAFVRLLDAAEARNWERVGALVAEDYRDDWGLSKPEAISLGLEALQHFLVLEIVAEDLRIERVGRSGAVFVRLKFLGRGSAIGEAIIRRVNGLESEFRFAWRRESWKPWDWKLFSVSQKEIDTTWIL